MRTELDPSLPSADVLEVHDLSVSFRTGGKELQAVRTVSFSVGRGESLGILGESGSGKSVTALAIMGLLDPQRTTVAGEILLAGQDLVPLRESGRRAVRGRKVAIVFQDALAALNPVQTVGRQIAEVSRCHGGKSRRAAREDALELMERVGIPAAGARYNSYPHELSGGMRQRVMIAIALAGRPELLIADEPTTSLDVTVQAQIVELLNRLRAELGMGLIFITHDLGLSLQVADRVAVMYAGEIVETGLASDVYRRPRHPYTAGLIKSMPQRTSEGARLTPIQGSPPSLSTPPGGCPFHPRCPLAEQRCRSIHPELRTIGASHRSACHLAETET